MPGKERETDASTVPGAGWHGFQLPVLDRESAAELFAREWYQSSGQPRPEDLPEEMADFAAGDLGGHPLSIVLTASHGYDYAGLDEVIAAWRERRAGVAE